MEDFLGIIIVIIAIVGSIISSARKEQQKQAAEQARKTAAAAQYQQAVQQRQTAAARPVPSPAVMESVHAAAPTVHPHIEPDCETHDIPGSLGVTSMEGKDPCHEEQLTNTRTLTEPPSQEGGLKLDWTGENLVKAFVMQEILARPGQRRSF